MLRHLEVWLTGQLLKSTLFVRMARQTHRRIHKARTGEELPPEVERTQLETNDPARKGFISHFVEEIKYQIKTRGKDM